VIYLKSFKLSPFIDRNPNAYPDHVFKQAAGEVLLFDRITVIYGNNGSGKSTLLNVIANKLALRGYESMLSNGYNSYAEPFLNFCSYELGEDEQERPIMNVPASSQYIKSEDILYEVKKIQQSAVLREGMLFEQAKKGLDKEQLEQAEQSRAFQKQVEVIQFAQEKYSNGETSMQLFDQLLTPNSLFLLDEPETSLSPQNQLLLAEEINELARYCNSQFIIASHSPFMLGTLQSKIYNLEASSLKICDWFELENIRLFYQFFQQHKREFER